MKAVVLSGTPKSEGLSASCVSAAVTGLEKAGASAVVIDLYEPSWLVFSVKTCILASTSK